MAYSADRWAVRVMALALEVVAENHADTAVLIILEGDGIVPAMEPRPSNTPGDRIEAAIEVPREGAHATD